MARIGQVYLFPQSADPVGHDGERRVTRRPRIRRRLSVDRPRPTQQSQGLRPAAKPNGLVVASREKHPAKAKPGAEDVAAKAKGVLSVVISIDRQQLTLYSDGHPIARSRVSTGVPGHPTPTGVLHRHSEGSLAPLQYLLQRADVFHAADHVVGRGHA